MLGKELRYTSYRLLGVIIKDTHHWLSSGFLKLYLDVEQKFSQQIFHSECVDTGGFERASAWGGSSGLRFGRHCLGHRNIWLCGGNLAQLSFCCGCSGVRGTTFL